ncbi:SDR family oxidoreductase [Solimicrobium silvestre]|uniref:Short-chain dehydrogenase of various substrate specificity n=1 Tax=Solimicrobium silvestre TaxID=2099400 RepID=A0A2S9H062_9BURK|nr:SDR family oxidoreductase [Solimicrobium silvestre]PRC93340.1 Short-chain dehydrogenase of various substrate specificity [Solimicrobium silvestre]
MPTVLIIGASRGIGLALVQEYHAAGWRVLATARQAADLEKLSTIGATPLPLDVTDLNDCAAIGWRLDDEKIDVAILSAGVIGTRTEGLDTPGADEFNHVMQTNVLAAMRLLPIIAPIVAASNGRLAVISSMMGSLSMRNDASSWLYRASKAALNSVLLDVAHSFPEMVSIAMHPGWVRTEMGGAGATLSGEQSAAGIRATIAARTKQDNGTFYNYDGTQLTW